MVNKEFGGVILSPYCSNFCIFCNPLRAKISDLELRQQEITIAKNLIDFKKKGFKKIEISGSDPIEYDKIIQLIKYIKKIGFEFIQLSTHGKRLCDESFLNGLISSGIDKLRIPIYGSNAKIHDSVTRTEGSFDTTLSGIKKLLKISPNIQIQISSLIVQQNKNNLIDLVDFVKRLKINDFYFSIPCIPNGDYSYYIPLKDLGPYVKRVYDHVLKIDYSIKFMEIPYCVFGKVNESINNSTLPPNLGKYCQPPQKHKSPIKDVPSYRLKKKIDMCNNCKCSNFCDGFFVKDINKFGVENLKPIRQYPENI